MSEEDLRRRIDDLEWRLHEYHDRLQDSLEFNTNFVLGAAWGVVQASAWLGFIGTSWGLTRLWKWFFEADPGWIGGALIAIPSLFVTLILASYIQKGREEDEKKLWRWPTWTPRL